MNAYSMYMGLCGGCLEWKRTLGWAIRREGEWDEGLLIGQSHCSALPVPEGCGSQRQSRWRPGVLILFFVNADGISFQTQVVTTLPITSIFKHRLRTEPLPSVAHVSCCPLNHRRKPVRCRMILTIQKSHWRLSQGQGHIANKQQSQSSNHWASSPRGSC